MTNSMPRRYILAAPPSEFAGIGNALRLAFSLPERASARMYEALLSRLNIRS
jgi:hypothetical protein